MTCCTTCGQPLPRAAPPGVTWPYVKARIFEAVRMAGTRGIQHRALWERVYGNDREGGPDNLRVLSVHIAQMNKRLRAQGLAIRTVRVDPHEGFRSVYALQELTR